MNKTCDEIIEIMQQKSEVVAVALGGSRARGKFSESSDYDLFVLLKDESFYGLFYSDIDNYLINNTDLTICAYMCYQDNWGYLHKAIDKDGIKYDISFLPLSRIREMGIKSSNVILFDKTGDYTKAIESAKDDYFEQNRIVIEKRQNIVFQTMIYFYEFQKSLILKQYWEQVKYLDRIRRNIMILERAKTGVISKHYFSPELNYDEDINDSVLKDEYTISGADSIIVTTALLKKRFLRLLSVEENSLWKKLFKKYETVDD